MSAVTVFLLSHDGSWKTLGDVRYDPQTGVEADDGARFMLTRVINGISPEDGMKFLHAIANDSNGYMATSPVKDE